MEAWPSGVNSTFYDIEAKAEQASTKAEMCGAMIAVQFPSVGILAGFMSGFLDRPVVDGTGLAGDFEITLQMPARRPASVDGAPANVGPDIAAQMNEFSDMLAQLVRDQLGLQVQAKKAPVEIFVIPMKCTEPVEETGTLRTATSRRRTRWRPGRR